MITKTEYITPGGARVIVIDPKSADFQERAEKAVAEFMVSVIKSKGEQT